jgi:hypothetical protein
MLPIDWIHAAMSVLFLVSSLILLGRKQVEHFFTRLVLSGWFLITVVDRDLSVESVRLFSTGLIIIMVLVEVASPVFRWRNARRKP